MSRQTPGNRMDGKANILALRPQPAGDFRYSALRLRYSHAVARHEDNLLCIGKVRGNRGHIGGNHLALDLLRRRGDGSPPAQNDRQEIPVHRATHDIGQDRT